MRVRTISHIVRSTVPFVHNEFVTATQCVVTKFSTTSRSTRFLKCRAVWLTQIFPYALPLVLTGDVYPTGGLACIRFLAKSHMSPTKVGCLRSSLGERHPLSPSALALANFGAAPAAYLPGLAAADPQLSFNSQHVHMFGLHYYL